MPDNIPLYYLFLLNILGFCPFCLYCAMNLFDFTTIPNTQGKYGMNKERLIIDFGKKRYIIPFDEDRKRVKIVYGGVRKSMGVERLFKETFGVAKRDEPEHPIVQTLRRHRDEIDQLIKTFGK